MVLGLGGGGGANFTAEKLNINYLSQVIKVDINSDKSVDIIYPGNDMMTTVSTLLLWSSY